MDPRAGGRAGPDRGGHRGRPRAARSPRRRPRGARRDGLDARGVSLRSSGRTPPSRSSMTCASTRPRLSTARSSASLRPATAGSTKQREAASGCAWATSTSYCASTPTRACCACCTSTACARSAWAERARVAVKVLHPVQARAVAPLSRGSELPRARRLRPPRPPRRARGRHVRIGGEHLLRRPGRRGAPDPPVELGRVGADLDDLEGAPLGTPHRRSGPRPRPPRRDPGALPGPRVAARQPSTPPGTRAWPAIPPRRASFPAAPRPPTGSGWRAGAVDGYFATFHAVPAALFVQ